MPRHPPCALNNLTNTTQNPPTHPEGAHGRATLSLSTFTSRKMLASTVQFSTNNQPPPHTGRTRPDPPQGNRRCATRSGLEPEKASTPSGPNSVPTTVAPPTIPVHAPTRGAVLGTGGVSRRPNWSAFHPRAPPQEPAAHPMVNRHALSVAL